ncbi:uncharacterized protein LOC119316705 isoform X2 [Triticum dicoccoides]|nr:uncharacterized protein LOC119316705 isoform X2 [Triticum dicoccoides]
MDQSSRGAPASLSHTQIMLCHHRELAHPYLTEVDLNGLKGTTVKSGWELKFKLGNYKVYTNCNLLIIEFVCFHVYCKRNPNRLLPTCSNPSASMMEVVSQPSDEDLCVLRFSSHVTPSLLSLLDVVCSWTSSAGCSCTGCFK